MSDGEKLITHDGTSLAIPIKKKPSLIDLLPSPKDAAREMMNDGPSDSLINYIWLSGKAPRG